MHEYWLKYLFKETKTWNHQTLRTLKYAKPDANSRSSNVTWVKASDCFGKATSNSINSGPCNTSNLNALITFVRANRIPNKYWFTASTTSTLKQKRHSYSIPLPFSWNWVFISSKVKGGSAEEMRDLYWIHFCQACTTADDVSHCHIQNLSH